MLEPVIRHVVVRDFRRAAVMEKLICPCRFDQTTGVYGDRGGTAFYQVGQLTNMSPLVILGEQRAEILSQLVMK